jgi:hypothetical protein
MSRGRLGLPRLERDFPLSPQLGRIQRITELLPLSRSLCTTTPPNAPTIPSLSFSRREKEIPFEEEL